jgi:hypothetical protein
MGTWKCWNGPGQSDVRGMKVHVQWLPGRVIWRYYNGLERMNVRDVQVRVHLLHAMVILKWDRASGPMG